MTKDVVKKYSNGEVEIVWKPNLCIHSENCWRGLPSVFSPKDRPWINPEAASTDEIITQVKKCPSGALSIEKAGESASSSQIDGRVQIEVASNGPLLVKGKSAFQRERKSCLMGKRLLFVVVEDLHENHFATAHTRK